MRLVGFSITPFKEKVSFKRYSSKDSLKKDLRYSLVTKKDGTFMFGMEDPKRGDFKGINVIGNCELIKIYLKHIMEKKKVTREYIYSPTQSEDRAGRIIDIIAPTTVEDEPLPEQVIRFRKNIRLYKY